MFFLFSLLIIIQINYCFGESSIFDYFYKDASSDNFQKWQKSLRQQLHQYPELQFQTFKTSKIIQNELKNWNIEHEANWAKHETNNMTGTGIVFDIGTGMAPAVLLRSDMDGLPVTENTNLPFSSLHEGRMHACGHDGHMAMLMGAVRLLKDENLKGTVRFMFQPAEEGLAGAEVMVNEGVLSRKPIIQRAFGQHVFPDLESGVIGTSRGALTASAETFKIKVTGSMGHAAHPDAAVDPIPVAAEIITAVYNLVARETIGFSDNNALVSVTGFNAGTEAGHNVIPSDAILFGTLRAHSMRMAQKIKKRIQTISEDISRTHNCKMSYESVQPFYPPLINNHSLVQEMEPIVKTASQSKSQCELNPMFIGEDFSFISSSVPSVFYVIGNGNATLSRLHDSHFIFNDEILARGSSLLAALAVDSLRTLSENNNYNK